MFVSGKEEKCRNSGAILSFSDAAGGKKARKDVPLEFVSIYLRQPRTIYTRVGAF